MHLIVTRSFPPELGGMQSLMWGLTNELSKNLLIKVFADFHESHKEFDRNSSFSIERIGGIKFLRKYRKAALVDEFIKENKVKGIIADHWKSLELIKSNTKKYCLIHSKEINHKKGSLINKRILKVLNNVEKVISNSEFTKNLAIDCGVNADKITVINPGVNPIENLDKKSIQQVESLLKIKSPRLITVSRLDKRKNHEKVIMALRNLKQVYPNIVYICIGGGEEEENIKKLVKELNLESQVMFFKEISFNLKNALLAKSDIFVMPSIIHNKSIEGFGILAVTLMKLRDFKEENFAKFHPGGSLGRRLLTTVGDVMKKKNLPIISSKATIKEVIQRISEGKLGLVVIIDNNKIIGIITDGDIRRTMESREKDFFNLKAEDLMSNHPKLIYETDKLISASTIMSQHKINSLLVVNETNDLVGVVQVYDLGV